MSQEESGWSLKHRDNIEHGPFELEDLIAAARTGNIATDTMLRHTKHTHNQWIIATRVANISQALSQPGTTPETKRAATSQNTSTAATSNNATREKAASHQPTPPGAAPQTSSPTPTAKSIFRRSRPSSEPHSGTPATKQSENTRETQGTDNQTPAKNRSKQRDLSIRNWQEDSLLVPRTLPDAFFAFFDLKFQCFITPWIIKIFWVIGVTAAIIMVVRLGYDNLLSPELNTEMAAKKATNGWQFEPLGKRALLSFPAARYCIYVLGIFCGTLLLRVACEASIVMFRIAGSLAEIKVILKEKKM